MEELEPCYRIPRRATFSRSVTYTNDIPESEGTSHVLSRRFAADEYQSGTNNKYVDV